jgi:hypothetical protein
MYISTIIILAFGTLIATAIALSLIELEFRSNSKKGYKDYE